MTKYDDKQSSPLVLGLDEAGRGPAIGPMVLAAVALSPSQSELLSSLGLRDSKLFGSGKKAKETRATLATAVITHATFFRIRVVHVNEVDKRVRLKQLNHLERDVATELIHLAPLCSRIVADGKTLFSPLTKVFPHLEAHNNGESVHPAVAAASILAKTRRDDLYAKICKRYEGEFGQIKGGGYVNAPTRSFLSNYYDQHGALPPEARKSWPHPYLNVN